MGNDSFNKQPKHAKHAKPEPAFESNSTLESQSDSSNKDKKKALLVVGLVCLFVAIALIVYLVVSQYQLSQAQKRLEETGTPSTSVENALADNPVDFLSLKEENQEIYAWIYIPNTNINYPIVQSFTDDNYYLDHTVEGNTSVEGAIYTQSCNSIDFQDPVTVIYGHNIHTPELMFHQLHLFEDTTFFNDNSTFYIYTPGHILTYQLIAAYEYDNKHILNTYNFSDTQVLQDYFNSVLSPNSLVANVRDGVTLSPSDKIVQLSTCVTSGNANSRYIVTGKLVNDQATK